MKRILVIGSSGAGKSTFARRLAEILQLELIHLDVLHWLPGWREPSKAEWRKMVAETVERESWIMDGNFTGSLDIRLPACDTVIVLDVPRMICLWRVLKRLFLYSKKRRPDMAEGCPEKFDWKFLLFIWGYPKRVKPRVQELIRRHCPNQRIIWLSSQQEIDDFLLETAEQNRFSVKDEPYESSHRR